MNLFREAVWVELLKARRSKMPLFSALGFALLPLIGGFFMIVLKDPELAKRVGLISAKAQILAGSADWPTFLNLITQGTAIGGIILFGFIGSWVFGREFSDQTVKDLLALPTPRAAIVLAKCVVVAIWTGGLVLWVSILSLAVGTSVGLPPVLPGTFSQGLVDFVTTAGMVIALTTPICFFASAGRGYLVPLAAAILVLTLAQVVAVAGWGEYFPWSIPALYAGLAGEGSTELGTASFLIVYLTSFLGLMGTFAWWELADQSH